MIMMHEFNSKKSVGRIVTRAHSPHYSLSLSPPHRGNRLYLISLLLYSFLAPNITFFPFANQMGAFGAHSSAQVASRISLS